MSEKLFEQFGQLLTTDVRDNQVLFWEKQIEESKLPRPLEKYVSTLTTMNPQQREMLQAIVPHIVDAVLHDFLLLLENEDWVTISLTSDNERVDDIRNISKGGLQGYVYIWAKQFSKARRSNYSSE